MYSVPIINKHKGICFFLAIGLNLRTDVWILIKFDVLGPYKGYLVPLSFINAPQKYTLIRECVLHLGECLLLFSAESFVFQFAIQKVKDQDI